MTGTKTKTSYKENKMNILSVQSKRNLLITTLVLFMILAGGNGLFAQMRDITGYQIVADMKVGWNLGNNFDSLGGDETAWGNPVPTEGLIDAIAAMGFKTIRIPVSWGEHVGPGPAYTIDPVRLDKVENVVNWALDNGMYAIVNMHHDNSWLIPTYSNEAAITQKFVAIWTQIAHRFRNYNDYLLFELMNEPRVEYSDEEWTGGTAENRDVINHLNQAGLDAVRATGGNNALRFVVMPTHAAATLNVAIRDFVAPADARIIVSQHTYYPYELCFETGGASTWGTDAEKAAMDAESDRIRNFWDEQFLPVIVGEWGTVNKNNTSVRVAHAAYYTQSIRSRGMLPIWWDNGYPDQNQFGLIDRSTWQWYFPEIAQAIVNAAGGPGDATPIPTLSPFPGYDCSAIPAWDAETIYDVSDTMVQYNGTVFANRWWTMGDVPDINGGDYAIWKILGPCSTSLTPTPLPGTTPAPTAVPTAVTTPAPTAVPTAVTTPAPTAVPTTPPTPAPTSVTGTLGDANGNGSVDIVDALLTAQYYVGLNPAGFILANADTNCNGTVDIVDALLIAQYYVGLISQFC